MVSGKRRKGPWMCSYHRNKTYKAKKKQKDQMTTNIQMFKKKVGIPLIPWIEIKGSLNLKTVKKKI